MNTKSILESSNLTLANENTNFDFEQAVGRTIHSFYCNGYYATSVQSLRKAMYVSENELIAAFGNKDKLFEAFLASYSYAIFSQVVSHIESAHNPLDAICSIIRKMVKLTVEDRKYHNSKSTNSSIELANKDRMIASAVNRTLVNIEDVFFKVLSSAHDNGQLDRSMNARQLARFLVNTLQGIRLIGQTTSDPVALNNIAEIAIRCLKQTE